MKKSALILGIVLCIGTAASAQSTTQKRTTQKRTVTTTQKRIVEDRREEFTGGLKVGMNVSNVWDRVGKDFQANPKPGFAGGGFLSIPIGKYLGVQPEVMFSQKGFKGSNIVGDVRYVYARTTSHIDVPVLVQVKPAPQVGIVLGPQYSYLLSTRDRFSSPSVDAVHKTTFRNDNIRRNTLGAVVGADVDVNPVVVSGRVGWDLQNNNGDGTSTNPRYKNEWLQLTVGYRF